MEHNIKTISKPKFFKDLKIGDVFTWDLFQSDSVFIKIEKACHESMESTWTINAINLMTGHATSFNDDDKISQIINPVVCGEIEE